jgi:hypothetical protein
MSKLAAIERRVVLFQPLDTVGSMEDEDCDLTSKVAAKHLVLLYTYYL